MSSTHQAPNGIPAPPTHTAPAAVDFDAPPPAYPDQRSAVGPAQASYTEARMPRGGYPMPTRGGPVDPAVNGYVPTGYTTRPGGVAVAPKSPGLALVASFFIPGLGTMINGQVGKGLGILACYLISLVLTVLIIGIFGVLGFWVYGMVDGYNGAKLWNARHGLYA